MNEKFLKLKEIRKNLLIKSRLIILNEDTFEETFSFRLNLMNVFVGGTLVSIFLIIITTVIIAFTPLREYIPGYSSSKLKRDATELAIKSDSLSQALKKNETYIKSIQKVLNGQLEYAKFNKDSILNSTTEVIAPEKLEASEQEMALREKVEQEEKEAAAIAKEKAKESKKRKVK